MTTFATGTAKHLLNNAGTQKETATVFSTSSVAVESALVVDGSRPPGPSVFTHKSAIGIVRTGLLPVETRPQASVALVSGTVSDNKLLVKDMKKEIVFQIKSTH